MNRNQIITTVADLGLPPGEWVVHASAVMVLHGLIAEAGDIDIVARGSAWERALALGSPVKGRRDLCVSLADLRVEVWSGWLDDDIDTLIDGAELVEGVACVSLAEVLRFKLITDRPKDQPHIETLRRHLQVAGGGVDTPEDG